MGFDVVTTEDTEGWTAFLRSLVARGLSGVELVISDAHGGIKAAIGTVFSEASWQRCRSYWRKNSKWRASSCLQCLQEFVAQEPGGSYRCSCEGWRHDPANRTSQPGYPKATAKRR